ncbi:trypsin domain-containing protein [Toxoplasma gondii GAB2-2007-GAL-DOM2]|uniref:Trypsin domain-containing protein n=5 Tax=Toxoplasma gondii TaxID=5811 RepID=S7W8J4_TOXGG|nr:trypsin domain-containing protein [Toxoplasma gondii GT1]KAF4638980.1 trypsin domain-containing protein [Toxoplasma gondii]KFG34324.1 trypsin domain-containing protein [Toxoplasma gondii GAB2-2007-GAL-DOM2]RQX70299.1 trypsin domain-containing protein [Toxoplasma gondii CAST]
MASVRSRPRASQRGAEPSDESAPSASLSPDVSALSPDVSSSRSTVSSQSPSEGKGRPRALRNMRSSQKSDRKELTTTRPSGTSTQRTSSTLGVRQLSTSASASSARKRVRASSRSSSSRANSTRRPRRRLAQASKTDREGGEGRATALLTTRPPRGNGADASVRAKQAKDETRTGTKTRSSASSRAASSARETEKASPLEEKRPKPAGHGRTRSRTRPSRDSQESQGGSERVRKSRKEKKFGCLGSDEDETATPRLGDSVIDEAAVKTILKSEVPNTVFKVFCTHCEPNYSQPWTTRRQTTSMSTGFVTLDANGKQCLLTNAHSVEHAAVVQVRKRGDHQKYEAEVLCIGLECDLAMLRVSDADFWKGLGPPLQWGPSPQLGDPVTVVGYPLGGDNSSVTQGVVSRADLQQYCLGSCSLLAIQIDAAINPGNSGGPALNRSSQCVGIAFQSLKDGDTENIGYIIPSEVVSHFLEDYRRHGRCLGFGDGGFTWQKLENKSLRHSLSLKSKDEGILIKKLDGGGPAKAVLQKGDILLEIGGKRIASDGTVAFRNGERILFTWILSQMFVGDRCSVKLLRQNRERRESFSVGKLNLLVPANSDLRRPQYLIVGGLVFVPLSEPFLKSEYGEDFESRAPVRLLDKWQHGFQSFPGEQFVLLSHVLAHDVTVGYEHLHNVQVQQFNGTSVKTLKHLAELVENSTEKYWRFDLDHDEVVVLEADAARRALPHILQRNMIRSCKSEDV